MAPLLLPVLLGCDPDPAASLPPRATVVRRFTSPDGETWALDPTPLATGFESLGLARAADGSFRLSGIDWGRERPWYERYLDARVDGFVGDGRAWAREQWMFDLGDAPFAIDPQWHGEAVWFVARKGKGGDPAKAKDPNEMRVTGEAGARYAAVGLADPMPVVVGGRLVVFATVWGTGVVQLEGEPLAEVRSFGGVSVPYARVDAERVDLLVQGVVDGKRAPMRRVSTDGARTWSSARPVVPMDGLASCTSPVMDRGADGWFLLCVDEGT